MIFLMKGGSTQRGLTVIRDGLIKEGLVFGKLNRLENQSRVRGSILWRVLPNRLKISCVRNDCRELLKLIQLVGSGKCSGHVIALYEQV